MSDPSEGIPKEWKPYQDANGNVVTVTRDQCAAIFHAIRIVNAVREKEGCRPLTVDQTIYWIESAEIRKSRLLGRILYEGKSPHLKRPPIEIGGPAWWLVPGDPDYKED